MTQRFTINGSDALEARLDELCALARARVLQAVPGRKICALLLGGGYGRGEGGVLETLDGDQPYNDLEFYILLAGNALLNQKLHGHRIHQISEDLTSQAGLEIEFKLLSLRNLERSQVSMFYYDLITGHRLIQGSDTWLANCDRHRAAHRIPLSEATRLLMNRCSGLLYAQEKLAQVRFSPEDADFVGRNLAKAKLALGDVLLAMRGQYHWSCRERHKRLRKLEADNALQQFSSVLPLHAQGVEFKLNPVRTARSPSELQAELEFVKEIALDLWLALESRRLNHSFASIEDYSLDPGDKCPETEGRRNRLINLRQFGVSGLFGLRCNRYPRERLLNSLPLLLWRHPATAQSNLTSFLQAQLRTSADSSSAFVRAYKLLWRNYN